MLAVCSSDFGMSQVQASTVKLMMGYPLDFLGLLALAVFIPYRRCRAAGEAAILTGVSVAFTLYGSLVLVDRGHRRISADNTVRSTLPEATLSALSNAESYYLAFIVSLGVLWAASRVSDRVLRNPPPAVSASADTRAQEPGASMGGEESEERARQS
jgi:hypothetical protein